MHRFDLSPIRNHAFFFKVIILKIKRIAVAILFLALAPLAWSQGAFRSGPNERAGEWNLSLEVLYLGSENLSGGSEPGQQVSSLGINDDWGFGFGFGYNFTNHLALSFDMNFLRPRYNATLVPEDPADGPETFSHHMDMFNGLVKGTYNLIDGPITPFVDLSAGFTYIDSNVADRPPTTGCWWDPWWGYICQTFTSTYSDTRFNYGGGVGIRWDINRDMFLRASYSIMKVDFGKTSDPEFGMGRLEIGWRY